MIVKHSDVWIYTRDMIWREQLLFLRLKKRIGKDIANLIISQIFNYSALDAIKIASLKGDLEAISDKKEGITFYHLDLIDIYKLVVECGKVSVYNFFINMNMSYSDKIAYCFIEDELLGIAEKYRSYNIRDIILNSGKVRDFSPAFLATMERFSRGGVSFYYGKMEEDGRNKQDKIVSIGINNWITHYSTSLYPDISDSIEIILEVFPEKFNNYVTVLLLQSLIIKNDWLVGQCFDVIMKFRDESCILNFLLTLLRENYMEYWSLMIETIIERRPEISILGLIDLCNDELKKNPLTRPNCLKLSVIKKMILSLTDRGLYY